ncbi:MAG TPA: SET domain-containing protein-lysine N-methyltransferase [Ilumatobacteraceae bacterium]|nr:SET domain-containing protein-lysine N-methyltransferase [Ilumatobacteraceae bacterium]HRB01893.1 SET domain-containing protein-lysine N-methyltransferase [Ilumatobacteraceae bacterium]
MSVSYLTPKARPVAVGATGRGSIAVEPIAAGEVVAAFGGRCLTRVEFDLLPVGQQVRSIQIGETLFLAGPVEPEPADFINHSCDPNCAMSGNTVVIAMRDIEVGDIISYDYATSDGCDYNEFECACGSTICRGKVTGCDWMLPELQLRYRGYFSPYLAARIASLATIGAERRAFSY